MSLWKVLVVVLLSSASAACGPEIRFDAGGFAAGDLDAVGDTTAQETSEHVALSSVIDLEQLPAVDAVQGRGEFSADLYDGRDGDLSAVIHAAEAMLVIDSNAEVMEGTFDDVSVGGASTRMLRRRLNDSERANYGDATGREVWLYDIEGYLCTATVADLWRVREEWAEPDDDGNTNEANRELMTASLLPTEGDCSGALYATPASRARGNAVFFAEVKAPEASLSARALEAFVGLAEYTQIQDDYGRGEWQPDAGGAAIPGRGAWTAHSDSGSSVTQFTDGSGRTLVRVAAWAGVGCGDFRADLWAVWERTPSGLALRAVSQGEVGAAFLLERGGRLSFGSESQLNTASGNHWAVSFTPLEPWSCPC